MPFAALFSLPEGCAPTHVTLARIDPIVSPHSVKGQQVSCIIFYSVNFCISGSASSSSWCCFLRGARASVARCKAEPSSSPRISKLHLDHKTTSTPRCEVVPPIMSPSSHTSRCFLYWTLCRITDFLVRPAAQVRVARCLARDFTDALSSHTRLTSLQFH